ncbi:Crp/Fnr family transcriptional regulator [Chryseobacterium sp. Ch-15]|uniref:Crp/Fnr family transcriptional regulator n=1 Tax=Chryseobacterium muglaense TaxID=2893752 RepID=A0A9Q3UUJ6_9FLAO|nr:Crp/Fnr family transcriptional regulator [Chryseobacterium muglaense]MBD3906485.1 Crp/Fnr family transcriptional regulator [Chryseobacterium muglaense]MCC9033990.1 Crp/Fnr family transcriptional regulator [Chryseobacterium muglaense]MCM2556193.1 Crp/Fnr family transcriptional regulator [Chryseobacterium muglaense]
MIQQFFQSFNLFSENEIHHLLVFFEERKLSKNDLFVKEGEKCKEIAFIQSGVFRSYYTSDEGKDSTYCFRFPNDLMASYSSFISDKPSIENMQAISEATLLVIKKEKIQKLVSENPKWNEFLRMIAEQEYLELEKRFFQLQRDDATQRYAFLIENQPDYIQKIPLQYLSSYLGITQRHLSRIRKEISF